MAKLIFRYGAMNSGKSALLQLVGHNYEEKDHKVILIKPGIDTKGGEKVVSRIGLERNVDEVIGKDELVISKLEKHLEGLSCIIVDEAQFMTGEQIEELFCITKLYDIPVIAYGLRTDFTTKGFEGAVRLLELSDEIDEMATICKCGKKARFNARKINGDFVRVGNSVLIDKSDELVEYEQLCGKCYLEEVVGIDKDDIGKIKIIKK